MYVLSEDVKLICDPKGTESRYIFTVNPIIHALIDVSGLQTFSRCCERPPASNNLQNDTETEW